MKQLGFCILYLAAISIASFFIGRALPYRWFHTDRFPFKSYPFEREGALYLKLRINKWQGKVPDMSRILPGLMPPKKIAKPTPEDLYVMVSETCVAELIHGLFALLGLGGLFICPTVWGGLVVAVYVLLGHVPFILIQRYNRPRLLKLKGKLEAKLQKGRSK